MTLQPDREPAPPRGMIAQTGNRPGGTLDRRTPPPWTTVLVLVLGGVAVLTFLLLA